MRGLDGKTALVTGGANGIGLAICRRLAEARCSIIMMDMNGAATEAACCELSSSSATVVPLITDVSDYDAVRTSIGKLAADRQKIDIVVNNAGWDRFMPFVDTTPAMWSKVIGINLFGTLNVLHSVLPGMIARGWGRVVNIASDSGRVGAAGEVAYSASKGGVIALTKALARELATKGITVNAVCPGPVETSLLNAVVDSSSNPEKFSAALLRAIPMRRLGQPEDVVGMVALLASNEAAYVTGQVVSVSGGLTMAG
jgi:2-hydroxycyclohexanecarboxyl-CoA dehydrogenase